MSSIECPYCDADCGIPDSEYNDGEAYEWDCDSCGKNFIFHSEQSIDYYSNKAPCLNGEEHQWEKINGYPMECFKGKYRCIFCDKRMEEKKNE